jgi:WD40 repeat protein
MSDEQRELETVASRGGSGPSAPGGRIAAGEVVAGYTVGEVAGAGGMGVVYRASDPELGRTVALKLIAPARSDDPRLRDLFVDESLTAAGLEHPNVIPIYRAGEDHGRLYIAMRFVEGSSLQDLIDAAPGGLPPGRAARIVARVADALDAAHARGLVHRDVKPGNILIADPDGEEHVYLTDFGLTVRGAGPIRAGSGGWAGTLAYLAPEQIRGGALDARTDVYALGCVLFHALTGRPPFSTDDEQAALTAHLTQRPPAPSELVPGLPPAMDEVVRRAMAKRPEDRFGSAGELGRAALAARHDAALLACEDDAGAARALAAALAEEGLHPVLAIAGDGPGTAEGVRASGGCAVLVGRAGLGEWAREGLAAASDLAARDRAFRLVLVLLPGAPDPGDPGLAFLATHPWVDLRAGTSDALAAQDIVRALRGEVSPGLGAAPTDACPYRGLEAFREEDADLFVGREQDTARLVQRLHSTRFLAVLGASGSGKSSLVRAGLLPAVRRGALPAGESWRVVDLVPGARPLAALASRLAHLPGAGAPSAADLGADERALDLALARALEGRPAGERVLVLVDQLEEAFTLCPDPGERAAFLSSLVYAATIPGGRAVVVVAMRSDFYHRLAEHSEMRALAAAQQVLVGPMDARSLRRAIEEPARRAGLELEPGLTRRILTDVADRPGTLPLLEYLLVELWQRRRGRTLTLEGYAASGGVEGALARRANAVYGAMSPERQALARRVLLRLTVPGEGTEDTRRRATMRELVVRPGEEPEVDAVVGALAEARLLTTGTDDTTGEPVVEVTHEALIRGWPELRGWINDDREQLRQHRRLSDAAAEWDASGRDDGQLYRGARLATWQERDRSDLNEQERDFLAASQERAERERATRRKRVKIGIGALAAVLVIVAGLAIFALISRQDAADQRDVAQSRQVAATARERLGPDPEQSLLLAREAFDLAPTTQAEGALRLAAAQSRVRFAYDGHQGPVRGLAISADGALVASAGDDGTIQLWSPERPDDPARVLRGHRGPVLAVAMSSDGTVVVSGGADGAVRTWDATTGEPGAVRQAGSEPVRAVATTPDGAVVAAGGDDALVRVWRGDSATPRVLRGQTAPVGGVALSPDGRLVAAGGGPDAEFNVPVWLWNADSGRLVRRFLGHTGTITGVAFTPDGGRVLASSFDYTVYSWEVAGQAPPVKLDTGGTALTSLSVSDDGAYVATGGTDGAAIVWSSDGDEIDDLEGHRAPVTAVALVPGSPLVLSAGEDGVVRASDWRAAEPVRLSTEDAATGQIEPAGDAVLYVTLAGGVARWEPASGGSEAVSPPPDGVVNWAAMDPALDIARSMGGGTITVTRADGRTVTPIAGLPDDAFQIALSTNGQWLAIADTEGRVRSWDLSGPTPEPAVSGRAKPNAPVAVSDAGAVAAAEEGVVHLWTGPGVPERTFEATGVSSLAFTPDGRHLAVGSRDRTVRVWPIAGGAPVALLRLGDGVQGISFSRDGRLLAAAATDQTEVWDWRRQFVLALWDDEGVLQAQFDESGRRVLTVGQFGMTLWTCDVCGSLDEVLDLAGARTTRELSDAERREFLVGS